MAHHEVREGERDGLSIRELVSPEGLVAGYAVGAGMVCGSLRMNGAELLGQRKGLRVYTYRDAAGAALARHVHPW